MFNEDKNATEPAAGRPTRRAPQPRRRPLLLNDIRDRAYEKWAAAGKPAGDCSRFWLEAEQETRETQ